MRWANKQSVPASTPIDTEGGRIPVQRSRYLQETYVIRTGKRPHKVSATIIPITCSSTCKFLNV